MRIAGNLAARLGFRRRQSLYASVLLFCLAYVLSPPSLTLRLAVLTAIGVSADLTFTHFAMGLIAAPLSAYLSGAKPEPTEVPEIREVAAEAGIKLPENAFYLTDKDIPAMTNGFSKRMVLSRTLLASLTRDELRFVGGHELTHIGDRRQTLGELLGLGLGAAVSTDLAFAVLGLPHSLLPVPAFAAMIIATYHAMRRAELRCDIGGARYAPEEAAVSALRKVYGPHGMDSASDSHPSGNSRVRNLRRFYKKRDRS